MTHPIFKSEPDGTTCQPSCPGDWSDYHDGYGDGYERGLAAPHEAPNGLRVADAIADALAPMLKYLRHKNGCSWRDYYRPEVTCSCGLAAANDKAVADLQAILSAIQAAP